MALLSVDGSTNYDLLAISSGDQIQVQIDPASLDGIQSLPSIGQRVDALIQRGYATDMATFIAQNLDSITSLPAQFLVHSIETMIDCSSGDGDGTYSVNIDFLNLVSLTGDGSVTAQVPGTTALTGTPQPPLEGQDVNDPGSQG
jgi:hypothetical protein